MRKAIGTGLVLWAIVAGAGSVFAQTPPDPNAPDAAAQTPAPTYTVEVTRSGDFLNVRIVTESREQADLLFGKEERHHPTIQIYKGDVLLNSGQFAFG